MRYLPLGLVVLAAVGSAEPALAQEDCSTTIFLTKICQTSATSPFSAGSRGPPACSGPVTPDQQSMLIAMFAIAPAQIRQQLCSTGQFFIGPPKAPSWSYHWNATPYMGISQSAFLPDATLLKFENDDVSGFWGRPVNLFQSAAVGQNLDLGPEWALLARVAHEVGHWIDPYDRARTPVCPQAYPVGACDLDKGSYFFPSWSYHVPLPPNYAFAWAHPWGVALRPTVMQARANLQKRLQPETFYDELLRACEPPLGGHPGLQGEFPSWFALTSPVEDFAEGFMYFALWKAGLTSLIITGSADSYDLMAILFTMPAPDCGFSKKAKLLEAYWQALAQ